MPIKRCTTDGGASGWKYGDSGKCYKNRSDAIKQMRAIKISESKGSAPDYSEEGLSYQELLELGIKDILNAYSQ